MKNVVFLYKENGTDDRDCVKYVDLGREFFECGHYFSKLMETGACFSGGEDFSRLDFDNITSILTKEEFLQLDAYNKALRDLGYGIEHNSERYKKGWELRASITPILNKLESAENEELFERVKEEEMEILMDEHNLDEDDIEEIFENYGLPYRDRAVVSVVFNDAEECGREYAENCMDIPSQLENYIDYEKLGEDLCQDECYVELSDGRVVYLMY